MQVEKMLDRLPPGAVESVQRLAISTMENSEEDHVRLLSSEAKRMADSLARMEFYWWQETLRTLITPDHCLDVMNYRRTDVQGN